MFVKCKFVSIIIDNLALMGPLIANTGVDVLETLARSTPFLIYITKDYIKKGVDPGPSPLSILSSLSFLTLVLFRSGHY